MKTKSVNVLLKHKFFLYGMVFLSVLQLVNFYKAGSLTCLGAFGVAYYLGCLNTKNKALCLLFANMVATFVLGCEKNLEGFREGLEDGKDGHDHAGLPEGHQQHQPPAPTGEVAPTGEEENRTGQGGNVPATDTQPPACSTFVADVDCNAQTDRCVWNDNKCKDK